MDQLDLLNAKDDIMSVASWLRNYMREITIQKIFIQIENKKNGLNLTSHCGNR